MIWGAVCDCCVEEIVTYYYPINCVPPNPVPVTTTTSTTTTIYVDSFLNKLKSK